MKQTKHSSQKSKTHTRLFSYTEQEEIRIGSAKKQAADFMETYGKGSRTSMVDYSHYANSNYRHEEKEQQ